MDVLNRQEVHVWKANYSLHYDRYLGYRELLNDQEKQQEARFATEVLRRRFVISRALLRQLLQRYLTLSNDKINFLYGEHGKPRLSYHLEELEFNLSHSHEMVIFGIAKGIPIGLDIEYIDNDIPVYDLEGIVFSDLEKKEFYSLPEKEKTLAFYQLWTRKEAVLKAEGIGLSKALETIEVTFGSKKKPQIIRIDGISNLAGTWSLHSIDSIPNYAGALAAKGMEIRFKGIYNL